MKKCRIIIKDNTKSYVTSDTGEPTWIYKLGNKSAGASIILANLVDNKNDSSTITYNPLRILICSESTMLVNNLINKTRVPFLH